MQVGEAPRVLSPGDKRGTMARVAHPENPLRAIPSVERLLQSAPGRALTERYRRERVVEVVRVVLEGVRREVASGEGVPSRDEILSRVEKSLEEAGRPRLVEVVNATGVGLHTNLGRAELPAAAIEELARVARAATTLEYDIVAGRRGERDAAVEEDLVALTGAEAATVVNNNAAAVLLALRTLARGREVVVSRGELIEIGGSFRLPEVMGASGARLREVGTTNRTHLDDYRRAIGPATALLLKVHTSNYRIVGFTASVALEELVALGREHGLPVMEDLGSGALVDLGAYGLPPEPVVSQRVAAGADLVTFSGDKLLGGPQAGLVVGRRTLVEAMRRDPLRRAVRPGKLTLAALAATLRLYREAPDLAAALPTMRWLTRPLAEIEYVGRAALPLLAARLGPGYSLALEPAEAEVGSGALPTVKLPSFAIAIRHPRIRPEHIAARFRRARPPVIGRVAADTFLLDLRGIYAPDALAVELPPEEEGGSETS